jgi:integrase
LRARAVRLARRTLIRYGQMAEAFVGWLETREGKGVRMRAFSRALLEDYWRELTAGSSGRWGGDRAVSTARKHLEVVRLLWEWAHDREEYDGQVPRPREVDLPRRAVTAPALAPSWAQMDDAIVTARGWLRCLFVVLRCTGLRVSQAMGLRWEDVQADSLRVRPELGKSQSEKHGRLIPRHPAGHDGRADQGAPPVLALHRDVAPVGAHDAEGHGKQDEKARHDGGLFRAYQGF